MNMHFTGSWFITFHLYHFGSGRMFCNLVSYIIQDFAERRASHNCLNKIHNIKKIKKKRKRKNKAPIELFLLHSVLKVLKLNTGQSVSMRCGRQQGQIILKRDQNFTKKAFAKIC